MQMKLSMTIQARYDLSYKAYNVYAYILPQLSFKKR